MDCLFCSIVAGDIPSTKVYEDDICYAFRDIDPQGPVHVLVVPKQHIQSVNAVDDTNKDIVAHIFTVIPKIAEAEGISRQGVHDTVKRAEKQLEEYEQKLGLLTLFEKQQAKAGLADTAADGQRQGFVFDALMIGETQAFFRARDFQLFEKRRFIYADAHR